MSLDMRIDQLVAQQRLVLRRLAESVAHEGCRLLEVGSWCGDSAVVLGNVAKRNNGKLFCIDWWKGNIGTDLERTAMHQDVFHVFWRRMKKRGLAATAVPIRASSDVVAQVLRQRRFDMVFIDADHRYEQVKRDIANYAPLVKPGGILCGHDCEGWAEDFDSEMLQAGRDLDYHGNIHCGVVLAVSEAFEDVSINCAVWSVRAGHVPGEWKPTALKFPELPHSGIAPPVLMEEYRAYNLIRYRGSVIAVAHAAGEMDIASLNAEKIAELSRTNMLFSSPSVEQARKWVDELSPNQ